LRVGISCARARKVVRKERDSYIHVMYVGLFQRDRGPPEYRSRIVAQWRSNWEARIPTEAP
jgi:hypothetical protein